MNTAEDLPVSECLTEILRALREDQSVVLKAPPGAGKTTGVAPAILSSESVSDGQVLLVQPRRLAARAAAARIAHLMQSPLGQKVGYHVRFDRKSSSQTKLLAMTTGVLLRRLQSDPLLEDVSCVILDEFHERSLDVDLALGMLQRIRTTLRPELKIVVMSATLDPKPISQFLGDAQAIVSEGRAYPVEVRFSQQFSRERIEEQVSAALPEILNEHDGHILVFLPGVGEIRRVHQAIRNLTNSQTIIHELYGDQPPKHQDHVLSESGYRKIILATNVAETSITIPGVTAVIDSGLARVLRFDAAVGLPRLQLEPISQAASEQRAGRAGRTAAGFCLRLWPESHHRSRRVRDTPEIERADFSWAALSLSAWGERDMKGFPWLTPPPKASVDTANRLLQKLQAIDDDLVTTEIGRQMLKLPIHPRLARFLISAVSLNVAEDAAIAAALLTERNPFDRGSSVPASSALHACDLAEKVQRLKSALDDSSSESLPRAAVKQVRRVADQLIRSLDQVDSTPGEDELSEPQRLARALLSAYPDRVARRRRDDPDRGLMVGGRGVRLDRRSRVRQGELFLCVDVDSRGSEAMVRSACAIEPEWLDETLVREMERPSFHRASGCVVNRRQRFFDDLLLAETPIKCVPGPRVAEILADAARSDLSQILPAKDEKITNFVQRVRFVTKTSPELDLPPLDDQFIDRVLVLLCQSRTSLQQLRGAPWLDHFTSMYDYDQLQLIDRHAPTKLTVPSGNVLNLHYNEGAAPYMEVRIQEVFGWTENPRIAGGRVPIQLHLLGPNHRAQQITEDLANFWKTTYHQVRKDLRRRYPKHHWPEDPTGAIATRNGLKPR